MEKELVWEMVQGQIGYEFKNVDLLKQAFTRSSYARENGGEDNEVLEFIGDKVLDFAVVKLLVQKYGHLEHGDYPAGTKRAVWKGKDICYHNVDGEQEKNFFSCDYSEGDLTKIKSRMVSKKALSNRMDELGFSEYLNMGKGDIQNNIDQEASVKEDLFEAIIGAVAIDCGWDQNTIESVVEVMLAPENFMADKTDTNYVRLIQEWEMRKNGCIPLYKYKQMSYQITWYMREENTIYQNIPLNYDDSKLKYQCYLKLLDSLPVFCGFGVSVREARMAVCKLAYEYLEEHDMLFTIGDEIKEPSRDMAINQLEILARRGYFSLPVYEFQLTHDKDGNPLWTCECYIKEQERCFDETLSVKKDAKKAAAYKMLRYVLGIEGSMAK